jgi:hypothetical protein
MSVMDSIGGFLADAAAKLHISVLSGNNNSHSPKDIDSVKLVRKNAKKIIDKSTHNDFSTHTTNNLTLQITGPIDPSLIPVELQPLVEAYKNKQITFVTAEQQNEVANLLNFEKTDQHAKSQLDFFKGKLAQADLNLIRTGLYLKHLRDTNQTDEANKQWRYITNNNTKRDRRIINLAGASYFNTYFRPLYKELSKDGANNDEFEQTFNTLINNMHFVVFVGSEMGVGELIGEVAEKAAKNIKYGVKDEIIYIHAAGNSIKTVEEALKDLRLMYGKVTTKRTPGKRLLKVSVYYRVDTPTDT